MIQIYKIQYSNIINYNTLVKKHNDKENFTNNVNFTGYSENISNSILQPKIWQSRDFSQKLKSIVSDDSNLLGVGLSYKTFDLTNIGCNDLLLKVPLNFNLEDLDKKFNIIVDLFQGKNFGQAVAKNKAGMELCKKVKGVPHGINSDILTGDNKVTSDMVVKFLQQVKQISEFKDSAYIDLAKQFDIVNKTNRFFVNPNPNNLFVDFEKQELRITNLLDKFVIPMYEGFKNDDNTMISLILDGMMHAVFYDKLTDAQKEDYKQYSKIIIDKCKKASKIVNLEKSQIPMREYFDFMMNYDSFIHNRRNEQPWSARYNIFRNLYSDVMPFENSNYLTSFTFDQLYRRIKNEKTIPDFYLSFLNKMNFINDNQVIDLIETFPEKLDTVDYKYFVQNKKPVTRYDTDAIIENRLDCLNAKICDEQSIDYINNIEHILETEFDKISQVPAGKKMVIITGLPASGKSHLVKKQFSKDYYIADVDIIKKLFPSYETEGKRTNNLHQISQNIMRQNIIPGVLKQGKNIVIPTTGLKEYIIWLTKLAKSNGYNVEIIHCPTSEIDSIHNVINRFETTGRFVDPYFVMLRAPYMKNPYKYFSYSDLIDKISIIDKY